MISIRPSRAAPCNRDSACSAPSGVLNFHTVNAVICSPVLLAPPRSAEVRRGPDRLGPQSLNLGASAGCRFPLVDVPGWAAWSTPGPDRAFGPPAPRRADLRCSGGHRVLGSARRRRWRWSHLGRPARPGNRRPTPGTRSFPRQVAPDPRPAAAGVEKSADGRRTAPGRRWLRGRGHLTLPGSWGALVLGSLSFTPSLLPRGGLPGAGLGHRRGHRLRGGCPRRMGLAGLHRPRPRARSWAWRTFLVSAGFCWSCRSDSVSTGSTRSAG